ncbi:MAG: hypothetical protein AAF205_08640, partial [Pseudomonadota bacterium]
MSRPIGLLLPIALLTACAAEPTPVSRSEPIMAPAMTETDEAATATADAALAAFFEGYNDATLARA